MNETASSELRPWSARRWWMSVLAVFALQVGAVFWLEDRAPLVPRRAGPSPVFRFAGEGLGEWLSLQDPTLFALPHHQGFSGEAWLDISAPGFDPSDWVDEPAQFLAPDVRFWGTVFSSFVKASAPPGLAMLSLPEPQIPSAEAVSIAPPLTGSRLRIRGHLAGRPLISPPRLPSWTNGDLLTNSVVQVLVDARGYPVSILLLGPGALPGTKQEQADKYALALARAARFEPLGGGAAPARSSPSAGLSVGTLIFEWQTVPAPATNSAPERP